MPFSSIQVFYETNLDGAAADWEDYKGLPLWADNYGF
jgi:hypothetical protein